MSVEGQNLAQWVCCKQVELRCVKNSKRALIDRCVVEYRQQHAIVVARCTAGNCGHAARIWNKIGLCQENVVCTPSLTDIASRGINLDQFIEPFRAQRGWGDRVKRAISLCNASHLQQWVERRIIECRHRSTGIGG